MKHICRNSLRRFAAAMLALLTGLTAVASLSVLVHANDECADTPHIFDFSTIDAVDACSGQFHVSTVPDDGCMTLRMHDTDGGTCVDPYFNLPLPQNADIEQYHWFAMLVKTNKSDLPGIVRFLTTSTGTFGGGDYPSQFFQYQSTDDWQLIVLDLTDRGQMKFFGADKPLTGAVINLRLDAFENECAASTLYQIRAYALFRTRAEAETLVHFKSRAQQGEEQTQRIDYADFWRGEAFKSPALSARMRWVTYGFGDTSPVDKFLRQGYGGIVSNVNFTPTYLQDDNEFATLAQVYDYAAEQGMSTWIYDEYQWPSGKAFGLVLDGHDELEATGVQHHRLTGSGGVATYTPGARDISVLRADITDADGTRTVQSPSLPLSVETAGDWVMDVYVLRKTFDGVEDRRDFTKLRDVDLLNPDAVSRFIAVTHQRYRDKMGDAFGHVEAFFTDEPQLGNRSRTGYCVWTPGLEDKFKATYGYELNLPSLFFGDSEADRICRINYYQLVASLFRTSYFEQIAAWCAANGTQSSGHLLFEEKMNDQIETYGGDFLQVVGAMDMPGVDLLWVDPDHLLSDNYIGSFMGMRYVTSAAKNAGKTRVMVEFNPDAANSLSKTDPLGECIAGASMTRLLGSNVYNVINPQMNFTNAQINQLNTYIGRLNTLLEGASETGQVAVFYPVATVQAYHNADSGHGSETCRDSRDTAFALDTKYQALCKTLLTDRILYTVVDDDALCRATVASDGCLCVGNGAYKVLVVPYTEYMSVEALQALVTFREAGGQVCFIGNTPAHGLRPGQDEAVATLMSRLSDCTAYTNVRSLTTAVHALVCDDMTVSGSSSAMKSLLYGDFETADRDITYLTNIGKADCTYTAAYTDGYTGTVSVYYPLTGLIEKKTVGDGLSLTIHRNEAVLIVREAVNDHMSRHTPYVPGTEVEPETNPVSDQDTMPLPAVDTDAQTAAPSDADTAVPTEADTRPGATGCASLLVAACPLTALAAAVLIKKRRTD